MSETNVVRKYPPPGMPRNPRSYAVVEPAINITGSSLTLSDATHYVVSQHRVSMGELIFQRVPTGVAYGMAAAGVVGGGLASGNLEYLLAEEVERLKAAHMQLSNDVAVLRKQLSDIQRQVDFDPPELRDIPDDQAKAEIKAYFGEHHGETLYASDVAAALLLDYDKVAGWLQELENDGQITIPDAADAG